MTTRTFVQVPPNAGGEKISAYQVPDGQGNNVDYQCVVNQDPENFADGERISPRLTYHAVAQASLNEVCIKASSSIPYGCDIFNNSGYPIFVKLFNKATAPVAGTDAPARTIGVQAGERAVWHDPKGLAGFSAGLAIAITKDIADFDSTPVAAYDCVVDLFYL